MKTAMQYILLVGIVAVTVICLIPTPVKQPKTITEPKQKAIKHVTPRPQRKQSVPSQPVSVLDHLLIKDN